MSYESQALSDIDYFEDGHEDGAEMLLHAQVHALLAVAHQQHIANLMQFALNDNAVLFSDHRHRRTWSLVQRLLEIEDPK